MPKIHFNKQVIEVTTGTNLRKALLKNQLSPYNPGARYFNCHGLGTCGTCAVSIEGAVSDMTSMEKWRLGFPPHHPENKLRLACQTNVLQDIHVEKHEGFWGQKVK